MIGSTTTSWLYLLAAVCSLFSAFMWWAAFTRNGDPTTGAGFGMWHVGITVTLLLLSHCYGKKSEEKGDGDE